MRRCPVTEAAGCTPTPQPQVPNPKFSGLPPRSAFASSAWLIRSVSGGRALNNQEAQTSCRTATTAPTPALSVGVISVVDQVHQRPQGHSNNSKLRLLTATTAPTSALGIGVVSMVDQIHQRHQVAGHHLRLAITIKAKVAAAQLQGRQTSGARKT